MEPSPSVIRRPRKHFISNYYPTFAFGMLTCRVPSVWKIQPVFCTKMKLLRSRSNARFTVGHMLINHWATRLLETRIVCKNRSISSMRDTCGHRQRGLSCCFSHVNWFVVQRQGRPENSLSMTIGLANPLKLTFVKRPNSSVSHYRDLGGYNRTFPRPQPDADSVLRSTCRRILAAHQPRLFLSLTRTLYQQQW